MHVQGCVPPGTLKTIRASREHASASMTGPEKFVDWRPRVMLQSWALFMENRELGWAVRAARPQHASWAGVEHALS